MNPERTGGGTGDVGVGVVIAEILDDAVDDDLALSVIEEVIGLGFVDANNVGGADDAGGGCDGGQWRFAGGDARSVTTAASAMDALNSSSAIILDLRDNSGGSPQMVMFLAAYFFDHPAFLWNPREGNESRMWTRSPVSRSRLASTPLFVLTSSRTYSAAEHFTYGLKMLHRAVIVGETTSGATDVGVFHRIDAHFGIGISESRVRNPYSTPDWAVTGVSPDVPVPADQALQAAQQRAAQLLAHR